MKVKTDEKEKSTKGKCQCTFVVLVSVLRVSTSADHRPARRNRNMKRVRHLREVNTRLLMRFSPSVSSRTRLLYTSTGPSSPEAAHVCRAVCLYF